MSTRSNDSKAQQTELISEPTTTNYEEKPDVPTSTFGLSGSLMRVWTEVSKVNYLSTILLNQSGITYFVTLSNLQHSFILFI